MNFKLHRIEAYIRTPEVTIRKVKIFGFMPMWTSLRFYVVYFTYFGVCFFDFLTTKLNTRESRCSKTTKYCLSLFSLFYPILRFGGPKTINPSPLSSWHTPWKNIDSTDTLIHQNMGILHNINILLPIGTKFYQQPNAVSSIEFSTWQAPFMSLLMNAPVMKLLPWYVWTRILSNWSRNVRRTSSGNIIFSAGALLGGVVASLLRQNHRPLLSARVFFDGREARGETLCGVFQGGSTFRKNAPFPFNLSVFFLLITQLSGPNNCLHQAFLYR